jgi:hypothetical protein
MSKAHDEFMAAFDKFLDKAGVADAMTVATTIFVSLVVSYAESKGADTNQPIEIDAGEQRDITIHPPKAMQQEHRRTTP